LYRSEHYQIEMLSLGSNNHKNNHKNDKNSIDPELANIILFLNHIVLFALDLSSEEFTGWDIL